jgi:hypothetical protein
MSDSPRKYRRLFCALITIMQYLTSSNLPILAPRLENSGTGVVGYLRLRLYAEPDV